MNKAEFKYFSPHHAAILQALTPFLVSDANIMPALLLMQMAEIIPERYPQKEQFESNIRKGLKDIALGDFGSRTHRDPFFTQAQERLKARYSKKDIPGLITSCLDAVLDGESQTVFPKTESITRTFHFLGYQTESDFFDEKDGVQKVITDRLDSYDIPIKDVSAAFEFARIAYESGQEPRRKSGELYICHPMRMIRYYLDLYEKQIMNHIRSSHTVISDIQVLYFHDILENVPEAKILKQNETYVLQLPNGDSFPISKEQTQTLVALHSLEPETTLQTALISDPTGKSAELKLIDKLDNLLTLDHHTKWLPILRNLLETWSSAGALSWQATIPRSLSDAYAHYKIMLEKNDFDVSLSVAMLSLALYYQSMNQIMTSVRQRLLQDYGVDLTDGEMERWKNSRMSQNDALSLSDFASEFSLETCAKAYESSNVDEDDGIHPFGYERDLKPFVHKIIASYTSRFPEQPAYPCMLYDVWERFSNEYMVRQGVRQAVCDILAVPGKISKSLRRAATVFFYGWGA